MELEPTFVANIILGVLLALGYLSRNFSASNRARRKETRRLRETVELYAGWAHSCEVHAASNGFTLPRKPRRLRQLEQMSDDEDDDDINEYRVPELRGERRE